MSTKFRITATKADSQKYAIDLGQDILQGMGDEAIREYAEVARVIEVQGHKDLLRSSVSADEVVSALVEMGYPDATAEIYVPTTKPKVLTLTDIRKALANGTIKLEDLENLKNQ